jgi:hypothetical protein
VVADKPGRQLTITFTSILQHPPAQSIPFDQVMGVMLPQNVRQEYVNNGPGRGGHTVTEIQQSLIIQLKDGTSLTVGQEQHQAGMMGMIGLAKSSVVEAGNKLATVIGVQVQTTGNAPLTAQAVGQAVESIVKPAATPPAPLTSPVQPAPATPPESPQLVQPPSAAPADPATSSDSTPTPPPPAT